MNHTCRDCGYKFTRGNHLKRHRGEVSPNKIACPVLKKAKEENNELDLPDETDILEENGVYTELLTKLQACSYVKWVSFCFVSAAISACQVFTLHYCCHWLIDIFSHTFHTACISVLSWHLVLTLHSNIEYFCTSLVTYHHVWYKPNFIIWSIQ